MIYLHINYILISKNNVSIFSLRYSKGRRTLGKTVYSSIEFNIFVGVCVGSGDLQQAGATQEDLIPILKQTELTSHLTLRSCGPTFPAESTV